MVDVNSLFYKQSNIVRADLGQRKIPYISGWKNIYQSVEFGFMQCLHEYKLNLSCLGIPNK